MIHWFTPRSARLVVLFAAVSLASDLMAQQNRHDFRGIDAQSFNPGRGNLVNGQYELGPNAQSHLHNHVGPGHSGFGNFRTSGTPLYGQQGMYQQFGGAPISTGSFGTYHHGHGVYGVGRSPGGVVNYSTGQMTPPMVPTAAFVGDPGVYGYGVGPFNQPWAGVNPYAFGYGTFQGGINVDPFTGLPVLHNPWCTSSLPYFGGVNPYFPGSILAPTVFNVNISIRPSVPSTASYGIADPRQQALGVAFAPPAMNFNPALPAIDQVLPNNKVIPDALPAPQRPGAPLLNEFEPIPRAEKETSLADRINSLRYQSTGDASFRKEDYASAETFYRSAIDMAPDRRGPWLRMAFVKIAQKDFPTAVSYLKTGLMMPSDSTRVWISAEELYGSKVAERARTHGGDLWNWLAEQPLSSDRLLLSGTFQKLRGHEAVAAELLNMASHRGPEAEYVTSVNELAASDIGQRAVSHDLAQIAQEESKKHPVAMEHKAASGKHDSTDADSKEITSGGITLRGKQAAPAKPPATISDAAAPVIEDPPTLDEPPALFIPKL